MIILYLFIYVILNILILNYIYNTLNLRNIEDYDLNYIILVIKKYTNFSPFFMLFFFLSGIPPVALFFIKFNFLLNAVNTLGLILSILAIFSMLVNMFFYIQIYNTNNKDIDFTKISIKPLKNNKFSYKCTKKYNDQLYKDTRRIVIVSFIMFFSIFFMADLYICTGGILVY